MISCCQLNISRRGSAQGIMDKNPLRLAKLDYSIRVVFISFHTFKIRYGGKQHKLHNILDQSWFYFTTKNCDAKDTLCQPGLFILNNTNYVTFWVSPGSILQNICDAKGTLCRPGLFQDIKQNTGCLKKPER